MRVSLSGANTLEWLVPNGGGEHTPARLAQGRSTAPQLATDLSLDPVPTRLLLDCLRSGGHVVTRGGRYQLSRSSRRWLDPGSELALARFVAGTADYWTWWGGLGEG